ncbi:hypothetical protein [Microbacterium rhizosphaerae]|uniref:Uncharacterized protein n=1 Tax=Microbacterium rhizosphaerae TaxID=1678237 RepID=A0ABZ0SK09_9MICO|nr:hypothetical protein [Microbacterium rhizosphaerae]WPR89155.1 hypothetical protein SM116_15535 [Microbacterium rhizosphaerae]
MELQAVWPHLRPDSRDWLIAHNGEALPPSILADVLAANGGSPDSSWWSRDDVGRLGLPDDAVDWIESVANGEIAA